MRQNCGTGVSVIIPTYNRAHLVPRAIDSALRAVSAGDEIIVVDDGSTDQTEKALAKYAGYIRYVKTENRGAGPARNLGVQLASADWIAFLDSDDEWMADHLQLHRNFLSKSNVLFSFSNFDVCYDNTPRKEPAKMRLVSWTGDSRSWDEIIGKGIPYTRFADLPSGRADFTVHIGSLYHQMLRSSYVPAWTSLVRRDRAGEILRFPEDLPTFEDYDCYVRLSKTGEAAYLDCATAINHAHEGARLNDADHLTRIATRRRILERNWGRDNEYLSKHRGSYASAMIELEKTRVKYFIIRGDTQSARLHLRNLSAPPLRYRLLSRLPGPVACLVSKLYLAAAGFLDHIR